MDGVERLALQQNDQDSMLSARAEALLPLAGLADPVSTDPMAAALLAAGISARHLQMAARRARVTEESLGLALYALGLVSGEALAQASAKVTALPFLGDAESTQLDLTTVTGMACLDLECGLPIRRQDDQLTLAIADPDARQRLPADYVGYRVAYVLVSRATLKRLYRRHFAGAEADYRRQAEKALAISRAMAQVESQPLPEALRQERLRQLTFTADVRELLLAMIRYAAFHGATDLQVQTAQAPGSASVGIVKMRWDGNWSTVDVLHAQTVAQLFLVAARAAGFSETRMREQVIFDGTFASEDAFGEDLTAAFRELRRDIDLRIAFGYADAGPGFTVRILERDAAGRDFDALQMDPTDKAAIREAVATQSGLIAITGPTGSGKTTLRYAILGLRDPESASIQTIENPVELRRPLWLQYAPRESGDEGSAMFDIFRGMLRNSPQVIDIAEVRHPEAFALMNRAAATGHLVCVTLHADDAPLALHMMRKSGVDDDDIANNVSLVIAVRLVRRLCELCRIPTAWNDLEAIDQQVLRDLAAECGEPIVKGQLFNASALGCVHCHAGYRGLIQIAELMQAREFAEPVRRGADVPTLRTQAIAPQNSLRGRGLGLAWSGVTAPAELRRVLPRRRY
jgi:type II secretory ATPase GspE/PulE/Tfp pilus assembly ATPase PilB-like protein